MRTLLKNSYTILLLLLALIFSFWLMFSTFDYYQGTIIVASKAWSDFGSHIPLIRSFSFGYNFPPEYPLFAGEPIHYHFLFYAFVGFLEKIGIPLHIALNVPSALAFFSLLVMLYVFGKSVFKSSAVGALAALFFICNGSFSFLYFFKNNPLSPASFQKITELNSFVSFHPYYGDNLISAFWNLNIYTNQRHLAAAFAFSLCVLFVFLRPILKNKNSESISISIFLGVILGLSFYFHIAAFGMTAVAIFLLSILFPKIRNSGIIILLLAALLAFPQYKYMNQGASAFGILFKIGYLTPLPVTLSSFVNYWTINLGLHILLIPIGFILSPKKVKKIFIAFFAFFVIGNMFQFSPEMAANHKFFNYFMLMGGMFSGYTIYIMWKKSFFLKPIAVILVFLTILSGVIDLFPIYNDTKVTIPDYPQNSDIQWIMKNTSPDAVFLNTSYFVPPESLAGRKILFGWPYFAWSQGYDTDKRGGYVDLLLSTENVEEFCALAKGNLTHFRTTSPPDTSFPPVNQVLLQSLKPSYINSQTGTTIYELEKNCK